MSIIFPVDYVAIRKSIVDEIQKVTCLTCILAEPERQDTPRPAKPYFTMKFATPGKKTGDDSAQNVPDVHGNPTTTWNRGGQRRVIIDFNCYGNSHEEAYAYMALWQSALELETVQQDLRASSENIAVCLNGSVADLSALLNTGYEGRSQMQVEFGVAANMTEDLGEIDTVPVTGQVEVDPENTETISATITI